MLPLAREDSLDVFGVKQKPGTIGSETQSHGIAMAIPQLAVEGQLSAADAQQVVEPEQG